MHPPLTSRPVSLCAIVPIEDRLEYQGNLLFAALIGTFVLMVLGDHFFQGHRLPSVLITMSPWFFTAGARGILGWKMARRGKRVPSPYPKDIARWKAWLPVVFLAVGLPFLIFFFWESIETSTIPIWYKALLVIALNVTGLAAMTWGGSAVKYVRERRGTGAAE